MRDEAAMCSWCWNSTDETSDRYSTCAQDQDPTALGPPIKMASEDTSDRSGPSFARSMDTDRGIPGHVGKEKQLHSATGYNIVVDGEGNVYGTREPYNNEAILQFHSRAPGEVQIKGKKSNLYLAMNDKGKVYAEILIGSMEVA
ncbi:hypothetical protein CDAR_392451 [Caerostris darwini]|uniref:Fibroblast growth factor n=1 Tax=Caerostris darwini TaxID=1538125 RepID=A0AAV4NVG9_9ARAC|nr:hypothetical protein CDAR_392451 [Caerostris darwini]